MTSYQPWLVDTCFFTRKSESESEKKDEVVTAPVGLAPPVDFAYLDMPQTQKAENEEDDWKELEDEDEDEDEDEED